MVYASDARGLVSFDNVGCVIFTDESGVKHLEKYWTKRDSLGKKKKLPSDPQVVDHHLASSNKCDKLGSTFAHVKNPENQKGRLNRLLSWQNCQMKTASHTCTVFKNTSHVHNGILVKLCEFHVLLWDPPGRGGRVTDSPIGEKTGAIWRTSCASEVQLTKSAGKW